MKVMFDSHLESYFLRNRGRYKGILFTLHVCMQQEVVYTYGNGSVRHYWRPLLAAVTLALRQTVLQTYQCYGA